MTSYNPNCGHVQCYGLTVCVAPKVYSATITGTTPTDERAALAAPDETMRAHIIIGVGPPATEAGRLWHEEWHDGESYYRAPKECGTLGCGFLGRILAIEAQARALPPDPERLARAWEAHRNTGHHPESTSGCFPARCLPAIVEEWPDD